MVSLFLLVNLVFDLLLLLSYQSNKWNIVHCSHRSLHAFTTTNFQTLFKKKKCVFIMRKIHFDSNIFFKKLEGKVWNRWENKIRKTNCTIICFAAHYSEKSY